MASEAVRKAPRLHLIVAGGGGVEASTGFDDRLVEQRPLAAGEMPHLANEFERALADPDLGKMRHGQVGSHQQVDLVVEGDPEGVANHRRPVLADQRRRGSQSHRDWLTRDDALAMRTAWRAASSMLAAAEIVDAGESPGPAGDHADADALILEQLHRRDDAVLDGEPLHGAIDHPAIGI